MTHLHRKAAAFTLCGEYHAPNSWRGVLVGICEVLAREHEEGFGPAACTVKGQSRQYVAASPEGMISPAAIPGTALWAEANQSARAVMQVVERLLSALGHPLEDLTITAL